MGDSELKFFDTSLSFQVDATGEIPATGQLALIPQGDTASTRDGRKAVIKSIQLHGSTTFVPGASATAASVCWLYLVLDTQCNGAVPANGVADVLTSTNFTIAIRNLNNSERFKILKKWCFRYISNAGVTTAYNNVIIPFDYYLKCNIPMIWNSTSGALTEITSNNLFLMAGSDNNSDDQVAVSGTCRLRFIG